MRYIKNWLWIISVNLFSLHASGQPLQTLFEKSNSLQTPDYFEIIQFYRKLDKASPRLSLIQTGMSDAGYPLHLAMFSNDGVFDPSAWHKTNKAVILINNGIHPGEPDGIDASMLLIRDLVTGKKKIPGNVALAIIPVYNIGGCLNRSTNYRVDQNGPEEFGSRGNSRNLDLNRDFIKCDSKEARAFAGIFHFLDPDIFIDNHVSNGADYQHVMTLISSQHSKLGGVMGEFMNTKFEPAIYALMKEKGYDLVPYVNFFGDTPDNGWPEFFDSPRYSSGYATLWHTFGFTAETHMLKPYKVRVLSTYALMEAFIAFGGRNATELTSLRTKAKKAVASQPVFPIRWEPDSSRSSKINFKGFTAGKKQSEVSGLPRLYYDRSKPFEKYVDFYNYYKPSLNVERPEAYVIPQGWWGVTDLLKINKVKMRRLQQDTILQVRVYHIADYTATSRPYESHHPNSNAKVNDTSISLFFRKGDYYVPMDQAANRFLIEVLEPQGNDSYFAWNFFDAILSQKEGYSAYVFEDTAGELLKSNPQLKSRLEQRKKADTAFANSAAAQLDFVFKNSAFAEPEYLRYPVYRVMKP